MRGRALATVNSGHDVAIERRPCSLGLHQPAWAKYAVKKNADAGIRAHSGASRLSLIQLGFLALFCSRAPGVMQCEGGGTEIFAVIPVGALGHFVVGFVRLFFADDAIANRRSEAGGASEHRETRRQLAD
jgi:hypothetical protein